MPSTAENNLIREKINVDYDNLQITIDLYDTPLTIRFLSALNDNLKNNRILEKNFCFLGWAGSKRNLRYLVKELNQYIGQINSFEFDPPYGKIHPFTPDDFQYSGSLATGSCPDGDVMSKPGLRLKHESCNLLHRHFEELQGTAWQLSSFYKQANSDTKYAIRQLNNLCHEIENWVLSHRKSVIDPEWIRPSQITTFLNAPRYDLIPEDYQLFQKNRYNRELGGVYLHWSQIGKTLYEVFRDEDAPKMTQSMCSQINHQKYYSGEFDIDWGQTITENNTFKKQEMTQFREWLKNNNFDWEDSKLALGYIKLGQVNLEATFGKKTFLEIYKEMKKNLNIKKIHITGENVSCEYPYTLESEDWKKIQIQGLKQGYESRSVR